jgi:TonB-linked SusC/RagA family outer membrane protein
MSQRRSLRGALALPLLAACALLAAPVHRASAQQATGRIEGTVIDSRSKQPLGAASVFVQGTGLGSQTNERGKYVLVNVPVGKYELRVRRIGFTNAAQPVTVEAGQVATVDFQMGEAAVSLDEVVVTGTAVATRAREVPTSTDIVNSQAFERAPVVNAQQVLEGRIPSVTVQAGSGQPGAGGSIKIRGTTTISQSTDPLIYVDGVRIFNEPTRNNWGSRNQSNPLQDINSDDIERIEVVKGAAATTLYGTEAAAGVIQIFTKKGMSGTTEWNANVTTGANMNSQWGDKKDPTHLFTQCDNRSNMYGIITSGSKRGQRQYFVDPTCPSDGNWTQPGGIQQYDLSVRGGGSKITYFVSGNYGDVKGILPTSASKDGGFRGNFSFFPMDKIQLSLNTAYTRRNTRWAGDGDNSEGFLLNVGRGNRNYLQGGKGDDCAAWTGTDTVCVTNGYVFDQTLSTRSDHFLSGFSLNWTPSSHIANRFAVGWDFTDFNNVTNLPFGFITLHDGYFWDENSRHTKLSLDYAGSLQNSLLSSRLASTFSWGGQLFRDRHRWTEIDVQSFAGPGDPTLETGAEMTYRRDRPTAQTNAGFFLQEQLAWHDRLFLTGGLRVDGNSAFGENFGLQKYPKLGLSYVLSDHEFWPKQWIETFKLRGAIGESGKAPGAFDALRTWSPVTADENVPGFTPGNVGNPDVGPERTRELETGFDASIAGGLLGLEFTHFRATTYDALVPVMQPPSNGFTQDRITNLGKLQNTGVELQANLAVLRRPNIDWRLRANASKLWNRAIDLGEQNEASTGQDSYIKEGHAFPQYYGKMVTNPDAFAAPITVSDTILGNVNPDRLFGFGTTLTIFNNLTFDALVEHQGGFMVQNWTAYQNARRGVWQPCYAIQEATYTGNTAALANVRALDRARCSLTDFYYTYWFEQADFTKLRYISATLQLPTKYFAAHGASVTLSARNLKTWTKYHGGDPEVEDAADRSALVGSAGFFGKDDYYMMPQPRTFTVSFRARF